MKYYVIDLISKDWETNIYNMYDTIYISALRRALVGLSIFVECMIFCLSVFYLCYLDTKRF